MPLGRGTWYRKYFSVDKNSAVAIENYTFFKNYTFLSMFDNVESR